MQFRIIGDFERSIKNIGNLGIPHAWDMTEKTYSVVSNVGCVMADAVWCFWLADQIYL